MARIKSEVREQALRNNAARLSSPPIAPKPPTVTHHVTPPKPSNCIDLTLDDDTDDEEEADEPLGPTHDTKPISVHSRASEVSMKREEDTTSGCAFDVDEDMEIEADDDDEDEDMPLPTRQAIDKAPQPQDMRTVVSTMVGNALNYVIPSFIRRNATDSSAVNGAGDHDDDDEEDEALPATAPISARQLAMSEEDEEVDEELPRTVTTTEVLPQEGDMARDVQDAQSDEDAMDAEPSATSSVSEDTVEEEGEGGGGCTDIAKRPAVGESLEDGEIFEEGAVVTSPTAVKQAIAEQLMQQAKKKQKKRGRKRAKRKAAAVQLVGPGPVLDSEASEYDQLDRAPPLMDPASSIPIVQPTRIVTMATTSFQPPRPFQTLQPPMPPPANHRTGYGLPLHAAHPYGDESIVRVHWPGGGQDPSPPPPPPVGGGFRYVSVDSFGTGSQAPRPLVAGRGMKRPLPPSYPEPVEPKIQSQPQAPESTDEPMLDLDSLRAAALRTKKSTTKKPATVIEDPTTESSATASTNQSRPPPPPPPPPPAEEDLSLDALREAILASKKRRVEKPPSAEAAPVESGLQKSDAAKPIDETPAPSAPSNHLMRPVPTPAFSSINVPDSPQVQPLTALSQSCVIRLSLDDLHEDHKKNRAYSYDDDAASARVKAAMVVAKTKTQSPPSSTCSDSTTSRSASPPAAASSGSSPVQDEVAASTTQDSEVLKQSQVKASVPAPIAPLTVNTSHAALGMQTGENALGTLQVPVDAVKIEQERAAMREADAQIARLDAEIAVLRRLIMEKEAAVGGAAAVAVAPPSFATCNV